MKQIPPIKAVMTPFPYSIAIDAPLSDAAQMMEEHEIRHLPVIEGDELVGVVSDRDLNRVVPSPYQPPTEQLHGRITRKKRDKEFGRTCCRC